MADHELSARFTVKRIKLETSSDTIGVGSSFACFLTLEDPLIQSEHCSLHYERGKFFVAAPESVTGTYVNGILVDGRTELSDGCEIILGVSRLKIAIVDSDTPDGGTLVIEARAKDFYFEEKGDLKSKFAVRPDVDYWVDSEASFGRYRTLILLNLIALIGAGILLGFGTLNRASREALVDPGTLARPHAAIFAANRNIEQTLFANQFGDAVKIARDKSCNACHEPFGKTPTESCQACHASIFEQHPYDSANATELCSACHVDHGNDSGFLPRPEQTPDTCSVCHDTRDAAWEEATRRDASPPQPAVGATFTTGYSKFSHQDHLSPDRSQPIACTACHGNAKESGDWWDPSTSREFGIVKFERCEECHSTDDKKRSETNIAHHAPEESRFEIKWHGAQDEDNCLQCHAKVFEPELRRTESLELFADFEFTLPPTSHIDPEVHSFPLDDGRDCKDCHWNEEGLSSVSIDKRFSHQLHMNALRGSPDLAGVPGDGMEVGTCLSCHQELLTAASLSDGPYRGATLESCQTCHLAAKAVHPQDKGLAGTKVLLDQPRVAFPHEPHLEVADGCFACHNFATGASTESLNSNPVGVVATIADQCLDCHKAHDNVGGGACQECHTTDDPVYFGKEWSSDWDGSAGFRHLSLGHSSLTEAQDGCSSCHDARGANGKMDTRVPSELEPACVSCHVEDRKRLHWLRPQSR